METKNVTKPTIEEIKEGVLKLLSTNTEWEKRYEDYIKIVKQVLKNKKTNYKLFRTPEQLSRYSSVSKRDGKTYDLRYEGKSMAIVCIRKKGIFIDPNIENLKKYGGFDEHFNRNKDRSWKSSYANNLRSHFKHKETDCTNNSQPEHRLENCMLRYFSSSNKPFNIVPVELYNSYFQMPTPLKASDHTILPTYAESSGGGIDILARVTPQERKDGEYSRLCVIELKDQNVENETQAEAMRQAVAYSVFIAKLLHSNSKQDWYNFFMGRNGELTNKGNVPTDLHIDVVTIMPDGKTEEYCGDDKDIKIDELKTTLHCHSLFFNEKKFNETREIAFNPESSTYMKKVKSK